MLMFLGGSGPAGTAGPAVSAEPGEIVLPLRGRPLRDRYVLRLIAVDRILHFLVLSVLAVAIFLLAGNKAALNSDSPASCETH
jgi:hypothetical protein